MVLIYRKTNRIIVFKTQRTTEENEINIYMIKLVN